MGRKQRQKRFLDDEFESVNTHLSFGDDDEVVEERKPPPKPEPAPRRSFSSKPASKPDQNGDDLLPKADGVVPPPRKKFKLDPKPEMIAFRKDLPIFSGTSSLALQWPSYSPYSFELDPIAKLLRFTGAFRPNHAITNAPRS